MFRFPDIPLGCTDVNDDDMCRMSAYDNVDERCPRAPPSETSEQTEFSDPWPESNMHESNSIHHQVCSIFI